jgi:hypothetical protein
MRSPSSPGADVIDALYAFSRLRAKRGALIQLPEPYDGAFRMEDTGIGARDVAELAIFLEARFNVGIDIMEFLHSRTLADAVGSVERRLHASKTRGRHASAHRPLTGALVRRLFTQLFGFVDLTQLRRFSKRAAESLTGQGSRYVNPKSS